MKKLLFLLVVITLSSCDDGDLQIETIDFDSITTITTCNTIDIAATNLLFKINDTEALILELPANVLKNEITTETIESNISASGPSKLIYRTFSDKATKDYFCSSVPLTTPTVLEEIIAKNGAVLITTTTEDNITYTHKIILNDITLETSSSQRITDLSISDYGDITTTVN
ncbi:hypothetical protein [uncultured Maribacter sp.]|uniref:hypothetical protein n=1 Tax=uncultured Maribacter sp. TaxID=431308 RepID=UPI00260867B0|nr:hypothetical protein [uncultured Maribacter sp.]